MYEGSINVIAFTNLNRIASKAFPRLDKISVSHWAGDHCTMGGSAPNANQTRVFSLLGSLPAFLGRWKYISKKKVSGIVE